jgi:hypothetical protein
MGAAGPPHLRQSCDMMLRIMVREFQGTYKEIYLTFRCEAMAGDKGSVSYGPS